MVRSRSATFVAIGLFAIAGVLTTTSCKRRSSRSSESKQAGGSLFVSSMVKRLQSPDKAARDAALEELRGQAEKLSPAVGIELLEATAQEFPQHRDGIWDIPTSIVSAVATNERVEYVPIIEKMFPRWKSASVRTQGLVLLSRMDDAGAVAMFMKLARAHAGELTGLPIWHLHAKPHHVDVFFPGLFELAAHDALADDVYATTLAFCEKGLLTAEVIKPHVPSIVAAYARELDWLRPKQREKGVAWMWEEGYQERRYRVTRLMELFKHFPSDAVEGGLREATSLRDPMLVHYALRTLAKHGKELSPQALEIVAASAEMRGELYQELEALGKTALFPRRYLTKQAFAESHLVQSLLDSDELGRVPDEIQLVQVVPRDAGGTDGIVDYYVFRFRMFEPHELAKEGWMAGVAGPIARKSTPSPDAGDETYSNFERWDAKTPKQHVDEVRALFEQAAAPQQDQGGDPWQ